MHCMIVMADGGYGCIVLLKGRNSRRMGGVMMIPKHLLRCHRFVGQSNFRTTTVDDDVESEYHQIDPKYDDSQDSTSDCGV